MTTDRSVLSRGVVAAGLIAVLAACGGSKGPTDQHLRALVIGLLADSPAIDDDQARCIGRTVVDEDGGGNFLRSFEEAVGDGDEALTAEAQEMGIELWDRIFRASADCGVAPEDVVPAFLGPTIA